MNREQQVPARRRRTRSEVRRLVSEFLSSGMPRSEFCHNRGLSFSTLDRHLKKRQWKKMTRSAPAEGKLLAVELATRKPLAEQQARSFFLPARCTSSTSSTRQPVCNAAAPAPISTNASAFTTSVQIVGIMRN